VVFYPPLLSCAKHNTTAQQYHLLTANITRRKANKTAKLRFAKSGEF